MSNIIWEQGNYRIIEEQDTFADMCNLKGDCYNSLVTPEIGVDVLAEQERDFERLVNREGVYGYVLEKWNPEVNRGWEHVDSCWGFVGQYSETEEVFNHYIVAELKRQAA